MSFELLRRTIIVNPTAIGAPYTITENFFDTAARKPYATQRDSQSNTGLDAPFELAKGVEVFRYDYRPGKTRLVLYNGNGSVYTRNQAGAMAPTLAVKADTTMPFTESGDSSDASVDLTGQYGQPPYEIVLTGTVGSNSNGYRQTGVSTSEVYPVRFYNLRQGQYVVLLRDALQNVTIADINVVGGSGVARGVELRLQKTVIVSVLMQWRYNNLDVKLYQRPADDPGLTILPYGVLIDGFLLPGSNGATWRQVYSDGKAGVYFVDSSTQASSDLALHNLILFHPDTTAEQNGGVLVETQGGTPPLRFVFTGPGGSQTNTTGKLDGLAAGAYQVRITDAAGGDSTVPFQLTDRYRLWKYLSYDNLDGVPLRVELWRRDFDGEATAICGTDQPVVIKSDGLSGSLGGQGDLPSVVGRSAELNFLADIDLFEPVVIGDDRNCRCDFYYDGRLDFRGYVKPDIYTAPLLDGLQPTSLVATDGLADLKDANMHGHVGQRLGGHFPVLNTLLHCLSRCEIALPVRIFTNRRDSAMATEEAPELFATTNRTGYYDEEKNELTDQRTVVDALAQLLGGTLVQRQGAWEVRSALEAALVAPGREYRAAGTPVRNLEAGVPGGRVLPPGLSRWHWLNATQHKEVRPGWKSLKGETDAGWLENAFWAGEVFNDVNAWLTDFSQLRGVLGWHAPTGGASFPLVLQRVGEKGKDHSTLWPRSSAFSVGDDRYLISPPLPLAAGLEAVPAYLSFTGKLVAQEYYLDYDGNTLPSPATALVATLPYEIVVDGHGTGIKQAEFKLVTGSSAADTTYEVKLEGLPSSSLSAVLKVYAWLAPDTNLAANSNQYFYYQTYAKGTTVFFDRGDGKGVQYYVARRPIVGTNPGAPPAVLLAPEEWAVITAPNYATGQLLLTRVAVQLRPQNATWEGEDNFRADGPAGSVRPTEALKVYHPDVPLSAGLFSGNLYAFGKGVGLVDGTQTTSWSRAIDLDASPLFEANVFDSLALRANPSRLVPGTIRHRSVPPPYLLDSVDTPFDQTKGRRFLVGAATWDTKAAEVEVSLIEIGKGEDADFQWPDGARITHRAYEFSPGRFLPYLRAVRGGAVRVRHG